MIQSIINKWNHLLTGKFLIWLKFIETGTEGIYNIVLEEISIDVRVESWF
jgi:hypothetical protein